MEPWASTTTSTWSTMALAASVSRALNWSWSRPKAPSTRQSTSSTFLPASRATRSTVFLVGSRVVGRVAITPMRLPRRTASRHISSSTRTMGTPMYLATSWAQSATSPTLLHRLSMASTPAWAACMYMPMSRAAGAVVT